MKEQDAGPDEVNEEDERTDSETPEVEEAYTPDEVLLIRLQSALTVFANRQSEVLRLASYVRDRSAEIDNAKARAIELIEQRLSEVDEEAFEGFWDVFQTIERDDLGDSSLTPEERSEAMQSAVSELAKTLPEGAAASYLDGVVMAQYAPPGASLLLSSLLVTLVGEVELFINYLARALIERRPDAIDAGGQKFSWTDVTQHGSIDDFRDHVVDKTIQEVLRGSLTDWMDFLEKRFDIAAPKQSREFEATELVQRRHVIVHNGGSASSQYLDKLKGFKHDVDPDEPLPVTHEYLTRAADNLYVIAFGLVMAAGLKHCKVDEGTHPVEQFTSNQTFYMLQEGRYELVEKIVDSVQLSRLKSDSSRLVFTVNRWIALKSLGRFAECKRQVERFETSSRSRDHTLAKLALLGEDEKAFELAQKMIRDDELKPEFLLTWPLLKDVRDYGRRLEDEAKSGVGSESSEDKENNRVQP